MVRKYRLEDWDADDRVLNDPNASWRSDPATIRQIQRLRSLKVKIRKGMTKGEASDIIGQVTTPRQRALLDYLGIKGLIGESVDLQVLMEEIHTSPKYAAKMDAWHRNKAKLHPDLYNPDGSYRDEHDKGGLFRPSEWPARKGKSRFGCLTFIVALALLSIGVSIVASIFRTQETAPVKPSFSTPAPSSSAERRHSIPTPKPVLKAGGKARLLSEASLKIQYGVWGIHAGAVVSVLSIDGKNITVEYQGQKGTLDADKLNPE